MKHTTLLSLDSSTKSTGYAVYEDGIFIKSGVFDESNEKDIKVRSTSMIVDILNLLQNEVPDIVVVESVHVNRNLAVIHALCELIGSIRGWTIMNNSFFYEIAPTEWRSAIGIQCGKGVKREEYKELSKNYIKSKYEINNIGDDQADAICIGDAYIKIFSN